MASETVIPLHGGESIAFFKCKITGDIVLNHSLGLSVKLPEKMWIHSIKKAASDEKVQKNNLLD